MQKIPFNRTLISKSIRSIALGSGTALALVIANPALADETSDEISILKEQMRLLMQRIDELEEKQADATKEQEQIQEEVAKVKEDVQTVPANVVTAGDEPGSFKLPGSHTSVSISGYIKGDLIYDLDADVGDSFAASAIPIDGTPAANQENHTRLHARQSRLRVRTKTELDDGDEIRTHWEGDFFGAGGNESFSNSSAFRIRHAYGEYEAAGGGTLLAGQTWTLFGGFEYASTVDFFGPAGQTFARQGQVRYTLPGGFAVSIENPETDGVGAAGRLRESTGGIGSDELPDLVVAWNGGPGGVAGTYNVSGVLRSLGVDGIAPAGTPLAGTQLNDTETGWGLHVGGTWSFGDSGSFFTAGLTGGDGVGRYIINGAANDIFVNPDGSISTVESWGGTAGLHLAVSDTSSVNLSYGRFENDNPGQSNGLDTVQTVHANYMFSPWPATNFGFEVIYGDNEVAGGGSGDAVRLQFGAQRSF